MDDAAYLAGVLDRALAMLEDGRVVDPADFVRERPDLKSKIIDELRLAEEIAVGKPGGGPTVPGYAVCGTLGRGAMGTVYLARQEKVGGRLVALKVLPMTAGMSAASCARFEREAMALAQIRHPHVVVIVDIVQQGEVYAYAMEWVDGVALSDLLQRLRAGGREPDLSTLEAALEMPDGESLSDPSPIAFFSRIFLEVTRALAAVHEAGFLHRDIKPSNILIRRDGTAFLSDFGLVRAVREESAEPLTQSGTFVGTAVYASPEQLRGSREIDARSDIYSIGAALYHALVLDPPYAGSSEHEILMRMSDSPPTAPRRKNPRVSRDLDTIVCKAIAADPGDRYSTASALADDLESLLRLEPIRARPLGVVRRCVLTMKRHRGGLVGVGVGSVLATVLLWILGIFGRDDGPSFEELVTRARFELLNPVAGESTFVAAVLQADNEKPGRRASVMEDYGHRVGALIASLEMQLASYENAIRLYDDALDRAAEPAERERAWSEAQVVRLAISAFRVASKEILANGAARPLRAMRERYPITCAVYDDWITNGGPRSIPAGRLGEASNADARALGLLARLVGEAGIAFDCWRTAGSDLSVEQPDPFIDACVGEYLLASGEPERALARLYVAFQSFPNAGFIAEMAVEAALRTGELKKAEEWIGTAENAAMNSPFGRLPRLKADLVVAKADRADPGAERERILREALTDYRRVAQTNWNPQSVEGLCYLLRRNGHYREAITHYSAVFYRYQDVTRYEDYYAGLFEEWWDSLDREEQDRELRSALDTPAFLEGNIIGHLRSYLTCVDERPPEAEHPLEELARRIDAEDVNKWRTAHLDPDWVKDCRVAAWRLPWSSLWNRLLSRLVQSLRQPPSPVTLPLASRFERDANDWSILPCLPGEARVEARNGHLEIHADPATFGGLVAPETFLGDWTNLNGRAALTYRFAWSEPRTRDSHGVTVWLAGPGGYASVYWGVGGLARHEWLQVTVPIRDRENTPEGEPPWIVRSGTWEDLLADVRFVWIRTWRDHVDPEQVRVDDIELVPFVQDS